MGKAAKILLGSVATALVTVGAAAQTGTIRWPEVGGAPGAGGAVQAQQATAPPSTEPSPSPSLSPPH